MSAIRKPAIPAAASQDLRLYPFLTALKENVEIITGVRPGIGEIQRLAGTASLADVINKINEVVVRLNASGK